MKDYATQIAAFETKRAGLIAANEAIMEKASEEGSTLDAEQKETFDGNEADVKEIDDHLKRLNSLQKSAIENAKPINGDNGKNGAESREGRIIVKAQEKLEPGMEFIRLLKSYGAAKGDMARAARLASARYGEDSNAAGALKAFEERGIDYFAFPGFEAVAQQKGNIVAGSAVSGTWASDLVLTDGGAFADFAEYLRAATILGKLGLRNVPFDTALGISAGAGSGAWVGDGKPKPLTSFDFNKTTLPPLKCANITVLTQDLLRRASANAEEMIRTEMKNALTALIDDSFIDPTNAGSANVEPAGIAYGAISIAASGTGDADDIRLDIRNLLQVFVNNNQEGAAPVLIMRTGTALGASFLVNALGQSEFPNVTMDGGTILGIKVITSQTVPSGVVVALQPSEVYYADEGGFMIDASDQASLQMLDNPTNDVVTPTATSMVSMFQTNSIAFRCERILNWARRRPNAAVYLTGAAWGGATNT